jgi:hypothetical protein
MEDESISLLFSLIGGQALAILTILIPLILLI